MSTHGCQFPAPSPGQCIPCVPQQLEQLPWLIPPSRLSPRGALMGCWVDPSRAPGSPSPPRPGCSWLQLNILAASEAGHQPHRCGSGLDSAHPLTSAGLPWTGGREAAILASGRILTCSRRWRTPSSFVLSAGSSLMPCRTPKASGVARGMVGRWSDGTGVDPSLTSSLVAGVK